MLESTRSRIYSDRVHEVFLEEVVFETGVKGRADQTAMALFWFSRL
jgi:hypothetical protein